MEMTKRKKIVGTVELVAAAAVLIVAVVFAPAYKTAVGESTVPQTEASAETPSQQEADSADAAENIMTTEPTTAPPEVGAYTVTPNYIVVTGDAAMEMYSVSKKKLTEYGGSARGKGIRPVGTHAHGILRSRGIQNGVAFTKARD